MHHPISVADYYEDQKSEAAAKAKAYRELRLPKFLGHFEAVLEANPDTKNSAQTYLVGTTTTTADLVLFHVRLVFTFLPRKKHSKAVACRRFSTA